MSVWDVANSTRTVRKSPGAAGPGSTTVRKSRDLPTTPTEPALAYCEARAVYGGLFTVLGAFTLWGAIDPAGKRSALLMAGLLWLGLCAGRSIGISIDGNPGIFGWVGVVWEAAFGTALVWAAIARLPTPANVGVE